jgi:hypothetical protein
MIRQTEVIVALCKWQGGACNRETNHRSGLCEKHRQSRFQLNEPFAKQNFLKWYNENKDVSPKAVKSFLDAYVKGDGTDEEKLQFLRAEIAAGRV